MTKPNIFMVNANQEILTGEILMTGIELILMTLSAYLRALEKSGYGNVSDFGKAHGIEPWMLSRIKNRQPGDPYEPKASAIWEMIKGMLADPPISFAEGSDYANIIREFEIGVEEMDKNPVMLMLQVADILSNKDSLDPNLFGAFIMMVATLHKQVVLAMKVNEKKDKVTETE